MLADLPAIAPRRPSAGVEPRASSRIPAAGQRGVALLWAMLASMLVAGIIVAGTGSQLAVDRMGDAEFSAEGQARAVAEAGLIDALAWFRRQQTQPVATFAPQRNLAASPTVNETDDPTVGLVREYEIMPSLWGRYEIRKPVAAEPYTDTNANGRYDHGEAYTDTDGDGVRDPAKECRDVSAERGFAGAGTVWRLISHGYVFRRRDAAQPLGASVNPRIAAVTVSAEIRRFVMVPPAVAAACVKTASGISIGARTRIAGGAKGGLIYLTGTGTPTISGGADISGTPGNGTVPSYDDTVQTMFGVSMPELKAMADASWSSAANFPAKIGDYTLNIVPGPITFDGARPLRGTGIVVVEGNCSLVAGNNAFFNGMLYVRGNLVMRGPTFIRGTVVVTGTADIAGTGGDFSEMNYDASIISEVLTILGQYRLSTATYQVADVLPDGTPDEGHLVFLQKQGKVLPGSPMPSSLGSSLP